MKKGNLSPGVNMQKSSDTNFNLNFSSPKNSDIEIIINMMKKFYAIDNYPFDENIARGCLEEFINNKNFGRIWLLSLNEKVIGYIIITFSYSFEFKGRDAFGDEFFIEKEYRGKGFGSETINFAQEELKKENIRAIHLEVEKHNPAKKWYKKLGFKAHGRILMTKYIS